MENLITYDNNKTHYVVATGIVVKDGKFLIAKRAAWEKNSPGKWTVPGGKLESKDYLSRKQDTADGNQWYNVIEELVRREIREETGIEIKNIGYVCSLIFIRSDGIPTLVVSLYADHDSGEIKLCDALSEYAWVSLEEAKKYDLIDGIYHELEILDRHLKTGESMCWKKQ
jgi:8-oxo-dGTP pyrophosphatase MutT (NUDIX family)